jgi:thioredoxin-like negative regulator of GroEL
MDKIAALSEILAQNPADSFARYGLAMALAAQNRPDEALREFATTTADNPDYVPAYQMSAQTLMQLGQTEAAKTRLTEGLAACRRTGNTHATSEMQAILDDLT